MVTRFFLLLLTVVSAGILTQCNLPTDPNTNHKFAKISKENVTSIPDTIPAGARYACTLMVSLLHLIDSIEVTVNENGDVSKLVWGKPVSDTIVFNLDFVKPAAYTVSIVVYKKVNDSLTQKVTVFSTTPVVAFQASSYAVHIGDSVNCPFVITDPDSNLLKFTVHNNADLIADSNVLAIERFKKTGVIKPMMYSSLNRENVFSISAVDEDNQYSIAQKCTVTISDTLKPVVHIIPPYNDTLFTVAVVPCTLTYVITENWRLDSIKISGFYRNVPLNDTLTLVKTYLDSGVTNDSIELLDRGGNRTVLTYKIIYNGAKQYPPRLKQLYIQPIFEHSTFDTIYLDSIVTITDSAASYTKGELLWSISADSTDPMIRVHHDTLKRTFYAEVPDTEIVRNRLAIYTFKVTDPKGLSSNFLHLYFNVLEKNDPPVITIPNQSKFFNTPFDTLVLAKCAHDPDPADRLNWTIQRGTYFKPDSIMSFSRVLSKSFSDYLPIRSRFTGRVAIIPDTAKTSKVPNTVGIVDSLKFTVTDGELTTSKFVKFTWYRFGKFTIDTLGIPYVIPGKE